MPPIPAPQTDHGLSPETDHTLTTLLRRVGRRHRLHHLTLALRSLDGERYWNGAWSPGDTVVETDEPYTPQTPFFIASITKRFIVTLLLQAHEHGELHLDAPLTDCLPASLTVGLHRRRGVDQTSRITLRHLASHTSGLPDFFERRRGGPSFYRTLRRGQDITWSFEDILTITRTQQTPHFDPGDPSAAKTPARYSDTGFQLLIRVLEHTTSQSFEQLLTDRIIEPLGMRNTWLAGSTTASGRTHSPLARRRRPVGIPGLISSSNDLCSTTDDLLSFEQALTRGRLFDDPATAHLLTARWNRLRNAPSLSYGLGTMSFTVNRLMSPLNRPVALIGHSGSSGTWLFTCPELGVSLAGTVDQTQARALPFRLMTRCLQIWAAERHVSEVGA